MNIPVEILCLWEQYYQRGDYKAICACLRKDDILCTPRQLVNHIHNANMPGEVYNVFSWYYLRHDK